MKKMPFLFVLFLEGCGMFHPAARTANNVINRRYRKLDSSMCQNDKDAPIEIRMRTALTIETPDTGKSIWNLDGRGQAAILSKLAKIEDAADLLNAKYQVDKDDPGSMDRTKPKISIVLSVRLKEFYSGLPNRFSLGDRLEFLKVSFFLDSAIRDSARFASWDKVSTQYGQVNLGSVGFGSTKDLTISPSIPFLGAASAANLSLGSFQNSTTSQEQDTLQQRLTTLNGVLQDGGFLIEEHGNTKWPVDGNTSINVTMDIFAKGELGYFIIEGLKKKDQYTPPEKVQPLTGQVQYPLFGDLYGTLTAKYAVRHIVNSNGADTYTEGDDEVQYIQGTITQHHVRLLLQRQVEKNFYGLVLHDGLQVHIQDTLSHGVEMHRPLYFRTFGEAGDFALWLHDQLHRYKEKEKDKPLRIGGFELYYVLPGELQHRLLTNTTDISSLETNIYTVPKKRAAGHPAGDKKEPAEEEGPE